MGIEDWKYYNHAAVPVCAPHEVPDTECIKKFGFWRKIGGKKQVFLARWTSDWDCGVETNFWYVIKDTPFDISKLKAKRRYEINKGIKYFDVKPINPIDYQESLFHVTIDAYSAWPEKYRPNVDYQSFIKSIQDWKSYLVFGAFEKETNELCGYAFLTPKGKCFDFNVLRTKPECECKAINAAIVNGILGYLNDKISEGYYICDGARAVRHETHFQDYLEKYFEFRKAYCRLHIRYRFPVKIAVKILFPFRNKIAESENKMASNISSLLEMEKIMR